MARYSHATWDPASTDGGSHVAGYAAKGVLHTTEGKSYAGARAAYRAHTGWPHFTVSFEASRFQCWQHIDTSRAARALKNPAGGVQTNRAHVTQIEIVGTCNRDNAGSWGSQYVERFPHPYLDGIADLLRWIEHTTGVQRQALSAEQWVAYPRSAGLHNGLRLSSNGWQSYSGWLGHQHVPENDHGDPGRLDIGYLLGAPAPEEDDVPLTEAEKDQIAAKTAALVKADIAAGLYRIGLVLQAGTPNSWFKPETTPELFKPGTAGANLADIRDGLADGLPPAAGTGT